MAKEKVQLSVEDRTRMTRLLQSIQGPLQQMSVLAWRAIAEKHPTVVKLKEGRTVVGYKIKLRPPDNRPAAGKKTVTLGPTCFQVASGPDISESSFYYCYDEEIGVCYLD
jgi:hypothetical protein